MKEVISGLLISMGVIAAMAAQDRPSPQSGARHSRWATSENGRQIVVETLGSIELTEDDRDIKSVSPNGYFELSSRGWLSLFGQRYMVSASADGTLTRVLTMGATERPIDAAASAWIGDTLQRLVREGFAAEARAAQILAQKGPAGVLDAAADISNDYAQAKYFTLLAARDQLDRATAERALREAGKDIGSDFELARVLVAFTEVAARDEAIMPAFVEATRSIGSDFEHSRVLRALIANQRHTPAVVNAVLTSSTTIGSDFEKARVFHELAEKTDLDASSVLGLIRESGTIGSDFEQSRVLRQIVSTQALDETSRQALIATAGKIGSDHERGRVLSALIQGGALR